MLYPGIRSLASESKVAYSRLFRYSVIQLFYSDTKIGEIEVIIYIYIL